MRKQFLIVGQFFTMFTVSSQILNQNFFFDFGSSDTLNGDVTVNPELNENYWNNINPVVGVASVPVNTQYLNLKKMTLLEMG